MKPEHVRYIGNAAVVDCTDDNTEYKLTGCEKKIFCQKPTVSGITSKYTVSLPELPMKQML